MKPFAYTIHALGDSALVLQLENVINTKVNRIIHTMASCIREQNWPGIIDLIPAYNSLTLIYDSGVIHNHSSGVVFNSIKSWFDQLITQLPNAEEHQSTLVEIPVCYDSSLNTDLDQLCLDHGLTAEKIIELHIDKLYDVYMLGFLPGFAYLGEVPDEIAFPRKKSPVQISAGAVGIAGKQTGVYPTNSPGGWQIIGYTPCKMFDKDSESLTLLQPGNKVKFKRISKDEYVSLKNRC